MVQVPGKVVVSWDVRKEGISTSRGRNTHLRRRGEKDGSVRLMSWHLSGDVSGTSC